MTQSISLSNEHYAFAWPEDVVKTPAELTALGIEYVDLAEGDAKEAK
jgi:hypothetical protein